MRDWLVCKFLVWIVLYIAYNPICLAKADLGVAIEPIIIKIQENNRVTNFYVYNNSGTEYVIISKVINDNKSEKGTNKVPFLVNPPIQILKKNSDISMGVIFLSGEGEGKKNDKYYLSVSFIPKFSSELKNTEIPIYLVHEIPILFE